MKVPFVRLLAAFSLGLILQAGGTTDAQERFLAGLDDLPLMPGLTETAGGRTTFETPGGRIVERNAAGDLSPSAVQRFYTDTLPQLGWQPVGDGSFTRAGEKLRIELSAGKKPLAVRFLITPG